MNAMARQRLPVTRNIGEFQRIEGLRVEDWQD
jgi:predicted nucleic acid-binding protein